MQEVKYLIIGDDYNAANENSIHVTFTAIPDFTVGVATGKLGFKNEAGTQHLWTNGVTTDNGDGTWDVFFELDKAETEVITFGVYDWSVEITEGGEEITVAKNETARDRILWAPKQT